MINKLMIIMCSVVLAFSIFGFTNYVPVPPNPNILVQERQNEKVIFEENQILYNNKANTEIRAKGLVQKDVDAKQQEKKESEEVQDKTKGQLLIKF